MKELPVVRVGVHEGDIVGADNRALQAAVDYISGLGGGTVEIGEGVYLMRDSLHLRSHVTVRGQGAKTVLLKAPAATSPLVLDGDYGEEQVTVKDAEGFRVGDGVAVWDPNSGGFHTTVGRISGKSGNTFSITFPLQSDYMVEAKAQAATVFPVISGYNIEGVRVENLTVDGARDRNPPLNGCRGAGIFLYRGFGTVIRNCQVRNYNGDGISFQQSNDVQVIACLSENNAGLGLHPGSGSQRPLVRESIARNNGSDGLYLCWRVQYGTFEGNELIGNGGQGISIGHKDSDNLLRNNIVRGNAGNGIYFREEEQPMAGNRNRLENNRIEDNGSAKGGAGITVDGATEGIVISGNVIADTREVSSRTQKTAIRLGKRSSGITIEKNQIHAEKDIEDFRH
ncbi:MAG TPA: right-handed parallel beta-helix repeat-containing protein [Bryobacteraceae bacterium]